MGEPKNVEQSGDVKVNPDPPENAAAVQIKTENAQAVQIEADQDQSIKMTDSDILSALNNKLVSNMLVNAFTLPKAVKRNVKALKKLQLEHVNIEVDFFKELHVLEMKYEKMFQNLYEKRHLIVSGEVVPTDEECDFQSDSEDKETELSNEIEKVKVGETENTEDDKDIKGIPEFWLTAFKNAPTIADMIEEYDEPILKHLIDIKAVTVAEPMSFYLEFHFEPNEFFSNTVLTKSYELRCAPDPSDVFSFEGPEIVKCKGCPIDWKKGKNVTVKTIKKKQKHKARGAVRTVTKTVQNDSFFNFFNPPITTAIDEDETELDEETQNFLNNDYEVGNLIKDRIIPHAVLFYTGENMVDDEFDEEDEDEEDEDYEEEDEDEDDDDDDNKQCLNRKKSQGQKQPQQAPSECQQQ